MKLNTKKQITLLLFFIILIQVIFITYIFHTKKDHYHSDEIWNYGLANSTIGPYLYAESTNVNKPTHINEWISSQFLKDYISVTDESRFNPRIAYHNAGLDIHPPLYFIILNFICSLFPHVWSKWFAYIINIFAFFIIQIFLYKFLDDLTKSKYVSILGVILFGFGAGAINITIFLRMYSLATALATAFAYYSHKVFVNRHNKETVKKPLILSFIYCLLGCLVTHPFLYFSFFIVLMYTFYYLFSKNIKLLFIYGFAMAFAVALTFIVFPAAIHHVFGIAQANTNTVAMSKNPSANSLLLFSLKSMFYFLTSDLFGFGYNPWSTMLIPYCIVTICILTPLSLAFWVLFRKEAWFKNFISAVKNKFSTLFKNINKDSFTILTLIITSIAVILITCINVSLVLMGEYIRRYYYIIYPIFFVAIIVIVYAILKFIISNTKAKNILFAIICSVFLLLSTINATDVFLFVYDTSGKTLSDLEDDANIIFVLSKSWLIQCVPHEIYNTNSYYVTFPDVYDKQTNYDNIDTSKPIYLAIDISFPYTDVSLDEDYETVSIEKSSFMSSQYNLKEADVIDFYKGLSISSCFEKVGTDNLFERELEIYRIN